MCDMMRVGLRGASSIGHGRGTVGAESGLAAERKTFAPSDLDDEARALETVIAIGRGRPPLSLFLRNALSTKSS